MENNKDKGAFGWGSDHHSEKGLTKREYFAGQALQGLMVQAIPGGHNTNAPHNNAYAAQHAVAMADALLEALES